MLHREANVQGPQLRSRWLAFMTFPVVIAGLAWGSGADWIDVLYIMELSTLYVLLATCAIVDSYSRKIPNWATYPAWLWALAISTGVSLTNVSASANSDSTVPGLPQALPIGIADAVGGSVVCFLLMVAIHSMARGGAGDVKLATAIGGLVGIRLGLLAICYTFILAGIVGLAIAVWIVGPVELTKTFARWLANFLLPLHVDPPREEQSRVLKWPMPLGVFFLGGTLLAILELPRVAQ